LLQSLSNIIKEIVRGEISSVKSLESVSLLVSSMMIDYSLNEVSQKNIIIHDNLFFISQGCRALDMCCRNIKDYPKQKKYVIQKCILLKKISTHIVCFAKILENKTINMQAFHKESSKIFITTMKKNKISF